MTPEDSGLQNLTKALRIDDATVIERKAFLELDSLSEQCLNDLHGDLESYTHEFVNSFYDDFDRFHALRHLLPTGPGLDRLKRTHSRYFRELTAGNYGIDYFEDRLRVGLVHERIGLGTDWYLAAYSRYLCGLMPLLFDLCGKDRDRFIAVQSALIKIVLLDMGLAVSAYIHARDKTISSLRDYAELVLDCMHDAVLVISPELRIESLNRRGAEMLGNGETTLRGSAIGSVFQSEELEQALRETFQASDILHSKTHQLRSIIGASHLHAHVTLKQVHLGDERTRVLMVIREITEEELARISAEARLAHSEAKLRQAQAVARIGSWSHSHVNTELETLEWSSEVFRLFGITDGVPLSYPCLLEQTHPEDREQVVGAWQAALRGKPFYVEHRVLVDGGLRWVEERAELTLGADGQLLSAIGTIQDITERKMAEQHIERLALFDSLTELPNRSYFKNELRRRLARARVQSGKLALLFIDLDRFKEINDTQGHLAGDRVLCELAQRFRSVLDEAYLLARLGGDEFVVIADELEADEIEKIALALLSTLDEPLNVRGLSFRLGASIGIAGYPKDGKSIENLLKCADIAMYRAKATGGRYCFYTQDMGERINRKLEMARRVNEALSGGLLQLYYQPKVSFRTGALTGAEALLRWHDPEWGWVSPAEFIPVMEERGMMGALGDWVLTQASWQLRAWKDAGLVVPPRTAINFAAPQFDDRSFIERYLRTIERDGLSPSNFELELTESSLARDPQYAMEATQALVQAGFVLSIDDFGTGYSSLAHLRDFPVNTLKIDRSFVDKLLTDKGSRSIVQTIIAMAQGLGLTPLAEGVETAEQAEQLRQMGCLECQGYYFGRPVPAEAFAESWLRPLAA